MIPKRLIPNIWIIALVACGFPVQAQWRSLGPFGGAVSIVRIDPNAPDSLLAATANASLFRSTNGGDSWTPLPFPGEFAATLHAAVVDPVSANTYLVGLSSDSPRFRGVFRSRDGGATWQQLPGMRNSQVWSLATWQSDPHVLAAGTEDGILLSTDGGDSWQRVSPAGTWNLGPVVSIAFDPGDRRIIYAGTPHLPWKTEDGGAHWKPVHDGIETDSDVFSLQVDWNQPGRIFAGACSGTYRTADGGGRWAKLKDVTDRTFVVAQNPSLAAVWLAGTNSGVMRSVNGGATWSKLLGYTTRSVAWDRAHPGRVFIATDDAGVLRSDDDGAHWREANRGLCSRHFLPLVESGGALFSTVLGEKPGSSVWMLPAASSDWKTAPGSSAGSKAPARNAERAAGDPIYVVDAGRIAASRDGGGTWDLLPAPSPVSAVLVVAGRVLAASESGLSSSEDGGRTWDRVDLPGGGEPIRELVALSPTAVAAVAAHRMWISFDGVSWKKAGAIPGAPEILDVAGDTSGVVLAATTAGLVRSQDFGASWQPAEGQLRDNTVEAIVRHPSRANVYFAAAFGLIYESSDGGSSWQPILSESLALGPIIQLLVVPGEPDRLFAMTDTHGVFELDYPPPRGGGPVTSARRAKF
jgi:photosystem II stability/assembly factor-like uncharacterized protein